MAIEERKRQTRTPVAARTHRVHRYAGRAHEALDDILGADGSGFVALSELGVGATRETIVELSRLQDRIEALKAKVLDHGDVIAVGTAADEDGVTPAIPGTTAAWYSSAVAMTRNSARRSVTLAKRLEDCFHSTARVLAAGRIDGEQARAVVDAVDALPDFVLEGERRDAETYLVDKAVAGHDVLDLKKMGTHLLEVIDPEGLDEYLAKKLAADEARAARACSFSMRDDGHGTVHGTFAIPGLNADMLAMALNAIASPKRPDAIDA